jgi:hypothetical protein
MEDKEWHFIDKSTWLPGPWHGEPDKKQFTDRATGYPCLIHRGPSGALCGYVGVSKTHPLYAKPYSNAYVDVHGGLTFAASCDPAPRFDGGGICHTVSAYEDDDIWWLGFDCAHAYDLMPGHIHSSPELSFLENMAPMWPGEPGTTYKDISYVMNECISLARQLKAIESGETEKPLKGEYDSD